MPPRLVVDGALVVARGTVMTSQATVMQPPTTITNERSRISRSSVTKEFPTYPGVADRESAGRLNDNDQITGAPEIVGRSMR